MRNGSRCSRFDVLDDNDLSREIIEETFRFAELAISDSHQSALHSGLAEASAAGAMFTGDFTKAPHSITNSSPPILRMRACCSRTETHLAGRSSTKEARAQ